MNMGPIETRWECVDWSFGSEQEPVNTRMNIWVP
jgi:hypothetical protein